MKLSTRYQAKGLFRIIRGTSMELAGRITSNRSRGFKGTCDRLAGMLQWRIGKVQGVFGL